MQKSTIFFTIDFYSKPLLKISSSVHLCTKKSVKAKIEQNDQKLENKCLKVIFLQKSTFFFTMDF